MGQRTEVDSQKKRDDVHIVSTSGLFTVLFASY